MPKRKLDAGEVVVSKEQITPTEVAVLENINIGFSGYIAFEDFEQNWSYEEVLPNGKIEIKRGSVSCMANVKFVPPQGWLHDREYEQRTKLKSQLKRGCWFLLPLGSRAQLPVKEV